MKITKFRNLFIFLYVFFCNILRDTIQRCRNNSLSYIPVVFESYFLLYLKFLYSVSFSLTVTNASQPQHKSFTAKINIYEILEQYNIGVHLSEMAENNQTVQTGAAAPPTFIIQNQFIETSFKSINCVLNSSDYFLNSMEACFGLGCTQLDTQRRKHNGETTCLSSKVLIIYF